MPLGMLVFTLYMTFFIAVSIFAYLLLNFKPFMKLIRLIFKERALEAELMEEIDLEVVKNPSFGK